MSLIKYNTIVCKFISLISLITCRNKHKIVMTQNDCHYIFDMKVFLLILFLPAWVIRPSWFVILIWRLKQYPWRTHIDLYLEVIEQWGFFYMSHQLWYSILFIWSSPRTHGIHVCCKVYDGWAETTCLNDIGIPLVEIELRSPACETNARSTTKKPQWVFIFVI